MKIFVWILLFLLVINVIAALITVLENLVVFPAF